MFFLSVLRQTKAKRESFDVIVDDTVARIRIRISQEVFKLIYFIRAHFF